MKPNTIASMISGGLANPAMTGPDGVVEIGLLLPTNRAAALLRLAQDRRESVGQVLRKLIERELAGPMNSDEVSVLPPARPPCPAL